jgi:NhaA family Na+:H+ antiporter
MLGTLGHRVRTAALDFASWGPSAGILLVLATVVAIVVTDSPIGPAFDAFWRQELGVSLGDAASRRLVKCIRLEHQKCLFYVIS